MATQTPNLGLTLPVGTENVSRTVMNGNNTLIDTFAGNMNTAMDQMGSNLGILETGDTATHSIAKGEYVTWKGASYTADAAISIGETLAATGGSKNLTACDKGIANALNSKLLWTNSSPTTSMGVTEISVSDEYNFYLIEYRPSTASSSDNVLEKVICTKGYITTACSISGSGGFGQTDLFTATRRFDATVSGKITTTKGYYILRSEGWTSDNSRCIPVKIWGFN